jgi:hypothetical protein
MVHIGLKCKQIKKNKNMKQILSLALALLPCLAWAQYPSNGNQKITLGEQTTADGLVYRGLAADTTRKPSVDTMAYIILDTTTNLLWHYKKATSNKWLRLNSLPSDTTSFNYVNTYGTQTVNGAKTFTNPTIFNSRIILTDTLTGFISTPKRIIAPQGYVGVGSGQLREMESLTIAAGTNPYSITTDPSGRFCYVANVGSNNVSQYSINQTTGQLTALATATISAGTQPLSITTDPSGRFCYVANYGSNNVSQYSINQTTGQLTALATATIAAGTNPYSITTDPSGRFCYVANFGSNNVSQYQVQNTMPGWFSAVDDEILIGYSADKGNYKLQVKDSVYIGGNVSANGFTTRSDFNLKENIEALDYGLYEIMQLIPVSYNLKSNNSKQLGFIAQEVGTIIPEAVSFEENLAIYYNNLISVIVKAIQELKQEIENLKNK